MMLTGKQTCPTTISPTINFTWSKPESNPGLCGEKPDTNLLTRGTDAVFITGPTARCVAVSWWIVTWYMFINFCKCSLHSYCSGQCSLVLMLVVSWPHAGHSRVLCHRNIMATKGIRSGVGQTIPHKGTPWAVTLTLQVVTGKLCWWPDGKLHDTNYAYNINVSV